MDLYQKLPESPDKLTGSSVLIRLVDGLGFRYRIATEGLTENEFGFRPIESSMSIFEVNRHIYQLLFWVTKAFVSEPLFSLSLQTFEDYRLATLKTCEILRDVLKNMPESEIQAKTIYLKRKDEHLSVFYIINRPLADALTHVGQINSWRRMAGNPVPKISPLTGDKY